jgi:hypothetical protein
MGRATSRRARITVMAISLAWLAACGSGGGQGTSPAASAPPSPATSASAPPATSVSPSPSPSTTAPPKPKLTGSQAAFFGPSFAPQSKGSFGLDRARVVSSDDPRFAQVLQVSYPKDSASTRSSKGDGTPHGGAQLYLPLAAGQVDELHLRYYQYLPAGFTWVKGGKLPGLYGGTVNNGRKIPDGTDGWSTRYMWRRDGAAEVYAYLPSSKLHGTSLGRGDWTWPTGRWTCVEQAVKLNTPGRSDGSVTVWLDGTQVYSKTGLVFRSVGGLKIDGLFFSTFFGGGDASWATPRDQSAQFAAFAVSPSYIGPLKGS